jgi:hypothetical protein
MMLHVLSAIVGAALLGAPTAWAQSYRKVTLTPQSIYTNATGDIEGVGFEILVRLTNISNQTQSGKVSLFGERLRVYLEQRGGNGTSFTNGSTQYTWANEGTNPPPTETRTFAKAECRPANANETPGFCDQPSVPARATQAGDPLGFQLQPAGSSGSSTTVSFRLYAHVGAGGIHTRWAKQGLTLVGNSVGPAINLDNQEADIVGNRTLAQALQGKVICRNGLDVAANRYQGQAAASYCDTVNGLMQVGYEYGISIEVNEARGAIVGSVIYRAFELGPRSINGITPVSGSLPLAGSKAF